MSSNKDFVLDTSLFMTEEVRKEDETMADAVKRLLKLIKETENKGFNFYMPSSTFEELEEIMRNSVNEETVSKLNAWISRKDPTKYEVKVSGEVVHDFIEDIRGRVDSGLRRAERAVRDLEDMDEEPDEEYYNKSDVVISDLRDDYKEKLRKGVIDSKEDLDLLLLAKEMDARLVSEDKGVLKWAEKFGIEQIRARKFPEVVEELE